MLGVVAKEYEYIYALRRGFTVPSGLIKFVCPNSRPQKMAKNKGWRRRQTSKDGLELDAFSAKRK